MLPAILPYILIIGGFAALIKGADFLVEGASTIARRLRISDLVIGLTVVAFGTSAPELFVNVTASIKDSPGISLGNVIGSNIANIFLILGASSSLRAIRVTRGTVWREIPLSLLAAVLLGILVNDHLIDRAPAPALSRSDGLVFLAFFIIFLYYSFTIARNLSALPTQIPSSSMGIARGVLWMVIGFGGLTLGGDWIVDGAVDLALRFGMSEALVGLTIVAVGTSLPELATSVMATSKGNMDLAVGNVVGSNIFNIFFVLGISSLIKPLPFDPLNNQDILVMTLANLLLFLTMFTGRKRALDRWEGVCFLLLYGFYLVFIGWRG